MVKPIALTMGDPAGIGPEIVVKTFLQGGTLTQACFVVGDTEIVRDAARIVAAGGIVPAIAVIESPEEAKHVPPGCVPVLQAAQKLFYSRKEIRLSTNLSRNFQDTQTILNRRVLL